MTNECGIANVRATGNVKVDTITYSAGERKLKQVSRLLYTQGMDLSRRRQNALTFARKVCKNGGISKFLGEIGLR